MKHIEGKFKGVKDLNIYYQAWIPNTPKAVIQLVHGGFEHSGRYQNVVNELIPESFAIYANDHLGHGKSISPRIEILHYSFSIRAKILFHFLTY